MNKHSKLNDNPEIQISFAKSNQSQNISQKYNIQYLRVQAIEKVILLKSVFTYTQKQLCQILANYSIFPYNHFNFNQLLASSKLKLIKTSSKIYFGQIEKKQRHGAAIMISHQKQIYQGMFKFNQKHGLGIEIYSNGNLYIGQFIDNKKHGNGTFYWFNMSPKVLSPHQQIQRYEGEWWGGLPDGKGIHIKVNNDYYIGGFKNGLKHGQGEQKYGNGDYYNGQFVNGVPQGYGEYIWNDGSYYHGQFKQGQRGGYGVWKIHYNRLQSYQGHYVNDKKSGHGLYTWDNGWCYKGNFQNDYRNGYGQLFDSKGKLIYKGQWHNGDQTQYMKNRKIQQTEEIQEDFVNNKYKSSNMSRQNSQTQKKIDFKLKRVQMNKHYNRHDEGQYTTLSPFGQQNICERPTRSYSSTKNQKFRIKNGNIGTHITRPLASNWKSQSSKNISRITKF